MTEPLSPSDDLLAYLVPDEGVIRRLLLVIREKAWHEGFAQGERRATAAYGPGHAATAGKVKEMAKSIAEQTSATTYGAGYDAGYQDAERGIRKATG